MKTTDIASELGLRVVSAGTDPLKKVTGAYVSDLLSDVIGNAREGQIWITLQTHVNVVAVASLKELSAIIIVKGLLPGEDTIARAGRENITILSTELETFEIAGRLYELLKRK
ncbi:MAG: DRTGG domain-containing protein [Bacteroidales bacterium]